MCADFRKGVFGMKKFLSFGLAMAVTLALIGCSSNDEQTASSQSSSISEDISEITEEKTYFYNGKEYKSNELSSDTIKWLETDISERALSSYCPGEFSVCIVTMIEQNVSFELTDEETAYISEITEEGSWQEGITECFMDYKITLNGKNLMYHSDCGTFNSSDHAFGAEKDGVSLKLSPPLKEKLNGILSKYPPK